MNNTEEGAASETTKGDNTLQFDDTIVINTTKSELWSTISDPEILTECVPGAENIQRVSKREYTFQITRGISHLTVSLDGEVEFVEMNEPDWIIAEGSAYDPKTGSDIDILSAMEMEEQDDKTVALTYSTTVSLTGGVASLGNKMVRPIIQSDINTYFENIKSVVEDR
ncbi:MAG: CoxG family protein [Halobacteriaceae archaeon]